MTAEFASQHDTVILHELDLGQHMLLIMEDQSIDLLDLSGRAPYLANAGIHLSAEETYRLFISLRELFQ